MPPLYPKSPLLAFFFGTLSIATSSPIVINELHIDDADSSVDTEFIELLNPSPEPVDISGWKLTGAVEFTFPPDTELPPSGFVVVAGDPATFSAEFPGVSALAPWVGKLRNEGETVTLLDASGTPVDEVDYQLGFPWPTVGDPPSPSMELIHPQLDNSLGGNWRSAGNPPQSSATTLNFITKSSPLWHYHKGDAIPATDGNGLGWTENGFDPSSPEWLQGTTPVGFGDGDDQTELLDMQGNYISVFLRHEFELHLTELPSSLKLKLLYDDGVVIWINGTQAGRYNLPGDLGTPLPDPILDGFADTREANGTYEEFEIPGTGALLTQGTNTIAVQLINDRIGSSDATFDCELTFEGNASTDPFSPRPPTPGARNSVFSSATPPAVRQVKHSPTSPTPASPVTVTAKITDPDGVANTTLLYQTVDPGDYINIADPRYQDGWTSVPMNDDGTSGDTIANDSIYTAVLPPEIHTHRRLVRYRIETIDTLGASVTAPYRDDPSPNFAYFVYGDIPEWQASVRPGAGEVTTFDFTQLQPLPVYHFITTRQHHEDAQYIPDSTRRSGDTSSVYRWQGTLVYDGEVYDHIRFRARGGVWRYAMGKNMWKFDFNRGHRFQARDDYGKKYKTDWDKLNFSAIIQQENIGRRGEQGLFEWAGFRLHNLLGTPAPNTNFVHFRIVEHADENGPTNSQYDTDFQGLYLAVEQMDGQFLDQHDLPDGNLYKMESGTGELNNQGLGQPTRKQDLTDFMRNWNTRTPQSYWEENLDLQNYYSFYAAVTFVHDNDIHSNKNYFFFNNPETSKWHLLNWDLDLTWTTTYRTDNATDGPIDDFVFRHQELNRDYRNRLRDGLDLLFNADQTGKLLDECANLVYDPDAPSFVDADRAMWDYNPIMTSRYVNPSKSGQGRYYARVNPRTYEGIIDEMKRYITTRKTRFIDQQARHLRGEASTVPATPTITYTGPANFPATEVSFTSSTFADPQGDNTFAAMRWRIGEIYHDDHPHYEPGTPFIYEIEPLWQSPDIETFTANMTIPTDVLRPGRVYRARVQHKDDTGIWSHWSAPVEFVPTAPDVTFYQQHLAISEFLYKPAPATAEEAALGYETSDFEWLELQNLSAAPLDLTGLRFTKGIDFDFAPGTTIPPNGFAILARNQQAFESRYGQAHNILGSFAPDNLSNAGEQLKLSIGAGTPIHDLTYDDAPPWPIEADTGGISLVLINPTGAPDHALPQNWAASTTFGGTPGTGSDPYEAWKSTNGVTSDLDDSDADTIPALLEFVLLSDPSTPSFDALPTINSGALTFRRRSSLGDINLTVETSLDLKSWTTLPQASLASAIINPDGSTTETWTLDAQETLHARIKATR